MKQTPGMMGPGRHGEEGQHLISCLEIWNNEPLLSALEDLEPLRQPQAFCSASSNIRLVHYSKASPCQEGRSSPKDTAAQPLLY